MTTMEFDEDTSDGGFYSDSASWASQQVVNSTSDLNDMVEDKRNSWSKSGPTVKMESSSASPDVDATSCEVCKQREADTSVVHFGSSHTSFCLDCASQCYARGKLCPLCTKLIVYFYKYNNI